MAGLPPVLGGWRRTRLIGRGSSGSTWRAVAEDGREAALKLLDAPPGDEARALGRITHPGVVVLLGAGNAPVPYLAMELAEGRTLAAWLRAGAAPEATAAAVLATVCDALAAIHDAGLAHGDVKPDNIVVRTLKPVRLQIVDLGLVGTSTGGTLAWASPERAEGGPATPAADVYAVGLIAWQLLHGEAPWNPENPLGTLALRAKAAPDLRVGAGWLRALVGRMLSPNAGDRPSAADVADALSIHGFATAEPDRGWLRRRAASAWVARPGATEVAQRLLEPRGVVRIVGAAGTGKSRTLRHLANEAVARGATVLSVAPEAAPWAAAFALLQTPLLPGPPVAPPDEPEPRRRAALVADLLETRAAGAGPIVVVADDLEDLDVGTALVIDELAQRRRCTILAGCAVGPGAVTLGPPEPAELAALLAQILGDADGPPLLEPVLALAGCSFAGAIDAVLAAAQRGAIRWHARRWVVDPVRLAELIRDGLPSLPIADELDPVSRTIGRRVAIAARPVPLPSLLEEGVEVALRTLVDLRLVRVDHRGVRPSDRAAAERLLWGADQVALHAEVLLQMPTDAPASVVAWHALGAQDAARAREVGAAAILQRLAEDPIDACRLAEALWVLAPTPALAGPRVAAMVAAGHLAEARDAALNWLASRAPDRSDVAVLTSLARLENLQAEGADRALTWIDRAADVLGDTPWPAALRVEQARAHFAAGRQESALAATTEVVNGSPDLDPGAWVAATIVHAQSLHRAGRLDEGIELLERVANERPETGPASAEVRATLGRLYWIAGRLLDAAAAFQSAARAEDGLSASARAKVLVNLGIVRHSTGDRAAALVAWEEALQLFGRIGARLDAVRANANLCVGYREADRLDRATAAGTAAVDGAREAGNVELEAASLGNLGDVHLAAGRFAEATATWDAAERHITTHGLDGEGVELARRRAELAVRRGDVDAIEAVEEAQRVCRATPIELSRVLALRAVALARLRRPEELEELAHRALDPLAEAGAAGELADVRLLVAEAWSAADRPDEARAELNRARVYATEVGNVALARRATALLDRLPDAEGARGATMDLLDLAAQVVQERDLDALLSRVAAVGRALLDADRCFVVLVESGTHVVAAADVRPGEAAEQPAMSIVHRALADRREVVAADLGERADLRANRSVAVMGLRAAMCVPMQDGGELYGVLYTDSHRRSAHPEDHALRMLRALAAQGAVAIGNSRRLAAERRKADHAAEIVHDLRGPLAAVLAMAESSTGSMEEIADEVRRALSLATRLTSPGDATPVVLDLGRVLGRCVGAWRRPAAARGVTLHLEIEGEPQVSCEPDDLRRALDNLVGNALKYSPDGGAIRLSVRVQAGRVLLDVADQGPGVPDGWNDRVFGRGVQAPGARTGSGLGLAITRRIVAAARGTIQVEAAPEGGARFRVNLPAA